MGDKIGIDRTHASDGVVRLLEEEARIGIREVTTGRVRISTAVETFEDVARADLQSDLVDVTRLAVNRAVVGTPPQTRVEGDITIIPIFEEVLVVEKRLMLKEELHIQRRTTVEPVAMPVTLRRQTADVEHLDAQPEAASR